jgi:nucleotide-binding universal stress UspA family protein
MKENTFLRNVKTPTNTRPSVYAQPFFSRILAPTDFSNGSKAAVDYAVALARRMQAQLTLLHVLPEPSAFDYTMNGCPLGEWDQAKEEAEKQLADAVAHAKRSFLEVDSKLRSGIELRDEIFRTVKEISADLLVLSTHGYTGWKLLLFGSEAEKILEGAPCSVLVVR